MLLQHPTRTLPLHHHHLNLLHTVYKCLGRDLVKTLFILSRKTSCDFLFKVSKTTSVENAKGEGSAMKLPSIQSPWDITSTNSGSGGLVEHSPSPGWWLTNILFPYSPSLTTHLPPTSTYNIFYCSVFGVTCRYWVTKLCADGSDPANLFFPVWAIYNSGSPILTFTAVQGSIRLLHHPVKTLPLHLTCWLSSSSPSTYSIEVSGERLGQNSLHSVQKNLMWLSLQSLQSNFSTSCLHRLKTGSPDGLSYSNFGWG